MGMETSSVFERLAGRFSEYGTCNSGEETNSLDVEQVMDTAGNVLFHAISSEEIHLGDIPPWFRIEPKGIRIGDNGTGESKDFVVHSWGLYWLCTINWLAKNKPDSGITFPGDIRCENPEKYLQQGLSVWEFLINLCGRPRKGDRRAWRQLARASYDACLYLEGKPAREADAGKAKFGFHKKEITPQEESES
jgi:hypothetical protein